MLRLTGMQGDLGCESLLDHCCRPGCKDAVGLEMAICMRNSSIGFSFCLVLPSLVYEPEKPHPKAMLQESANEVVIRWALAVGLLDGLGSLLKTIGQARICSLLGIAHFPLQQHRMSQGDKHCLLRQANSQLALQQPSRPLHHAVDSCS